MTVVYKDVHNTSYHYAEIYKRNKLLASSRNRIGSRSRGPGWSEYSLHAELGAIKNVGDMSKLVGCVMIVMRVNKTNEIMGSKPCADCQKILLKCMKQYGLLKVLYSV